MCLLLRNFSIDLQHPATNTSYHLSTESLLERVAEAMSDPAPPIDWSTGIKFGMVSIGSHSLFLSASGPDRQGTGPAVIIIPGVTSTIAEWPAVRRLLEPFARVYLYDRSGYGQSQESPQAPSAENVVAELGRLLAAAHVTPPYVLVGHSWGGILAREFLHRQPDDVAGMVLVDAVDENTNGVIPFHDPDLETIWGEVDYLGISGIRANHRLTEPEWQAFLAEEKRPSYKKQAEKEAAEVVRSEQQLAQRGQLERATPVLGSKPLSVIASREGADYERMAAAGIAEGKGSRAQREKLAKILDRIGEKLETVQREQLGLSLHSNFVQAACGHNIQFLQPELIAEQVRWVLDEAKHAG